MIMVQAKQISYCVVVCIFNKKLTKTMTMGIVMASFICCLSSKVKRDKNNALDNATANYNCLTRRDGVRW